MKRRICTKNLFHLCRLIRLLTRAPIGGTDNQCQCHFWVFEAFWSTIRKMRLFFNVWRLRGKISTRAMTRWHWLERRPWLLIIHFQKNHWIIYFLAYLGKIFMNTLVGGFWLAKLSWFNQSQVSITENSRTAWIKVIRNHESIYLLPFVHLHEGPKWYCTGLFVLVNCMMMMIPWVKSSLIL